MARILVAEDDADVAAVVGRGLERAGHAVTLEADGAAALARLTAEPDGFDLLLTDIQMPIMDGIALALAVARDHPRLPILLMTGYAEQRERAAGLEALVSDVVMKPFTLAELTAAVAKALTRARGL